jgi:hypothetical protein
MNTDLWVCSNGKLILLTMWVCDGAVLIYRNFWYYPSRLLYLKTPPFGDLFCLSLQVQLTQLGLVDRDRATFWSLERQRVALSVAPN